MPLRNLESKSLYGSRINPVTRSLFGIDAGFGFFLSALRFIVAVMTFGLAGNFQVFGTSSEASLVGRSLDSVCMFRSVTQRWHVSELGPEDASSDDGVLQTGLALIQLSTTLFTHLAGASTGKCSPVAAPFTARPVISRDLSPEHPPKISSVRHLRGADDEAIEIHGRADHRDFAGAVGRGKDGVCLPQARD